MTPNLRFQIVGIDPDPHSIYPRLRIQVNVRAENVGQTDTYIGIDGLRLDSSILNENGVEKHLPTAYSDSGSYMVGTFENSIIFIMDLDHFGLSQIERIRNNKDIRLKASLRFSFEMPSQYVDRTTKFPIKQAGTQQLQEYTIPKSVWLERILPAFNFKEVFLLEIPKLMENADTAELAKHLSRALDKLSSGDYPGVLTDCQKALEETKAIAKKKGYTRVVESAERIDFGHFSDKEKIQEALEKSWQGVWGFGQAGGRHIGGERGKDEAWLSILSTFGLVNLIVNYMLETEPQKDKKA
jgi:TusA-related sulfurtransferase